MKLFIFMVISGLSLLGSCSVWSCSGDSMYTDCQQSSCGQTQSRCGETQNYCQCADINCGKNPCLNKADCCSSFGNVGDNKLQESEF